MATHLPRAPQSNLASLARFAALIAVMFLAIGCPDPSAPKGPGTPKGPNPTPQPLATPTPAPSPFGGQLTVTWYAYYQRDIQYFEVYRADAEEGPWKRVSSEDEPIYGEGYSEELRRYDFVDRTVKPGQTYYYYIGKVSLTGRRSRHTLSTLKARGRSLAEVNSTPSEYGPDRPVTVTPAPSDAPTSGTLTSEATTADDATSASRTVAP